jgi:hypothetical protein
MVNRARDYADRTPPWQFRKSRHHQLRQAWIGAALRRNIAPGNMPSSRKEEAMYAAIRQAKAKSGSAEELARRIKDGAVPIISDVDGFRAYYVVYAGDDTVTAISIFDKFEQAEEANKRAIAWIEKDLGPLLAGHASAAAGPVIVHTLA